MWAGCRALLGRKTLPRPAHNAAAGACSFSSVSACSPTLPRWLPLSRGLQRTPGARVWTVPPHQGAAAAVTANRCCKQAQQKQPAAAWRLAMPGPLAQALTAAADGSAPPAGLHGASNSNRSPALLLYICHMSQLYSLYTTFVFTCHPPVRDNICGEGPLRVFISGLHQRLLTCVRFTLVKQNSGTSYHPSS